MQSSITRVAPNYSCIITAVLFGIGLTLPCTLAAQETPFAAYSAAGPNATSIQAVVDSFRNAVGAPNNANAPGPLPGGRREINWDGGGVATSIAATPFAGFKVNRGALFTTPGTGFVQAPASGLATTFSNPTYSTIFTTFSPQRLFSPIDSNVTDVHFFRPGEDIPATVNGFGAVFTDVDLPESTSIEYFDAQGQSLGKTFVAPADNGLSFAGLVFANQRVAMVRITTGNAAPGPIDGAEVDVVVMDDFIYGEPLVGPPVEIDDCKNGGWRLFDVPRAFRNQGDCIRFVNTGE